MGDQSDLFTALNMFKQGVQDLSLSRTLSSANDAVAQIKAQEGSEQQKRAQLQDLSNNLVRNLGAMGVEPQKIAQQADAVSHIYKSPAEAAIQGTLTGNQDLVTGAIQADIASQSGNIAQLRVQQQGQMALQDKKFAQALLLGKGGKPLNSNEIDKLQKYDEVQLAGTNLLSMVQAKPGLVGPIASHIPGREMVDPDFAVFQSQAGQFFDKYRIAVTGAGASPGELRALMKNVPSGTDTPINFRKKMAAMLSIGSRVRQRYLDNLSKAGRSVSNFTTTGSADGAAGADESSGGDDLAKFVIGE